MPANGFSCLTRPTRAMLWEAVEDWIAKNEAEIKGVEATVAKLVRERPKVKRQMDAGMVILRDSVANARRVLDEVKKLPEC